MGYLHKYHQTLKLRHPRDIFFVAPACPMCGSENTRMLMKEIESNECSTTHYYLAVRKKITIEAKMEFLGYECIHCHNKWF
ncbi:MAG: hypothetical protein ACFFC7_30140 [Candidatus Hermodarchaeota archaeon]